MKQSLRQKWEHKRFCIWTWQLLPHVQFICLYTTTKFPCSRRQDFPVKHKQYMVELPVYGVGLRPLACWDCGFESCQGHGCLSLVSFVCCHVVVFAASWLLLQRSATVCGASLCLIYKPREWGGHCPRWAAGPKEKKVWLNSSCSSLLSFLRVLSIVFFKVCSSVPRSTNNSIVFAVTLPLFRRWSHLFRHKTFEFLLRFQN